MEIVELLKPYRTKIDEIDDQIIDLLVQRVGIIDEVADLKLEHDIPAVLQDRVEDVIHRCMARAEGKQLDTEMIRMLYSILVAWCCDREERIITQNSAYSA